MKYAVILPFVLLVLICEVVRADTCLLKDGQTLKGVVVEDYHDRITLSTEKGEAELLKKAIEKIVYDSPEENLVKLGAFYKDKGDYKLALYYYEAAYKLSPDMKEAKEGTLLITNMLFRKKETDLEKEIALRQEAEEKIGQPAQTQEADAAGQEAIDELSASVGIYIENVGPVVKVSRVVKGSPAYEAGIERGDIIVSIWGKLLKYTPLENVYALFLNSKVNELRVAISRGYSVLLKKTHLFRSAEEMIGAQLVMEFEGLTIGEVKPGGPIDKTGILKGDRLTRLGEVSTRYMPLESACKLIEGAKDDSLSLEIQREIIFWRK